MWRGARRLACRPPGGTIPGNSWAELSAGLRARRLQRFEQRLARLAGFLEAGLALVVADGAPRQRPDRACRRGVQELELTQQALDRPNLVGVVGRPRLRWRCRLGLGRRLQQSGIDLARWLSG